MGRNMESLRLEDVRKTLGARLTRETRTGTKSDSERCYIVQTKAERAKEKDDVQERRCCLMRGDPERNMSKQTVRGRRQPYTLPIPQEKTQESKPKEKTPRI